MVLSLHVFVCFQGGVEKPHSDWWLKSLSGLPGGTTTWWHGRDEERTLSYLCLFPPLLSHLPTITCHVFISTSPGLDPSTPALLGRQGSPIVHHNHNHPPLSVCVRARLCGCIAGDGAAMVYSYRHKMVIKGKSFKVRSCLEFPSRWCYRSLGLLSNATRRK